MYLIDVFFLRRLPPFSTRKIHWSENSNTDLIVTRSALYKIGVRLFWSMYFSCRKWRDHDTTEQQTSTLAMAWLMSSPTQRKTWTTPMMLCHIMMAGSDPLIFYAGFSENSQCRKMEGGQYHPFFGGKRQQTDGIWEKYIDQIHRLIQQF